MTLAIHHAAIVHGWPAAHAGPLPPWLCFTPARQPAALTPAGSFTLRREVRDCLGRSAARAYGLEPGPAPFVLGHVASRIADQLARDGYHPGEVRKLVRKARLVDGLSRFARSGVVSLSTTLPVTLAAGAGALVGASVGAVAGGVGAVVGAPLGAIAGACAAAPAAAVLSTAMYAIDDKHRREAGKEFTERVSMERGKSRALNALAYASGTLAANAPLTAAQAIASLGMATGLATTAIWGGVGLLAAPAVAVGAVGVRVSVQEALTTRVPGRVLGLSRGAAPLGGVEWNAVTMRESLHRLQHRSTAGLVMDDLRQFFKLLHEELPGELRNALHPDRGLKQTALNAALLVGGQALGQAAVMGVGAAGVSDAAATAAGRLMQHGPGAAAWGAGRPVAKPARGGKPARRTSGLAL